MAGAGYKLFATGDVLTAAQVNTYLMQQTIMVFASSAARTTALSGVLAEGMVTYLQDTNSLEFYDGTSWIAAVGDITGVTAGTGLTGGGTSGTVTLNVDNTIIQGYTTTATAGGTTTLTASSTTRQLFTGTLNQTIVLPVTSTLSLGSSFKIRNLSTGTLTVNSSGGNLVVSIPSGAVFVCTCILTSGTTAASWDADFEGTSGITGTGNAVLATSPTITTPVISSIVNTGTLTLPTSTDTLVGRATTDTLTNKTLTAPRITSASNIADANGNELILFPTAVASAVNEITVSNAATAGTPSITASGGDTNISLNLVAKGTGTVQAGGVPVVTTTGTQTLTNKTLTTPVISSITNTGTITLPTSTDTLVGRATTDTLTNKTLTTPTINNGTLNTVTENNPVIISPEERTTVTAGAPTATTNFDALTQGVQFYTSNATTNFTLNFRGNAGTTLNTMLATGDAFSCVLLVTNGATAYYANAFQIDSVAVTPRWAGGTAPTSGNANSTDVYSFTIIKTAATPTYTVLAGVTRFA